MEREMEMEMEMEVETTEPSSCGKRSFEIDDDNDDVEMVEDAASGLSPEQAAAFLKFTQGQNLFISGPGGSGKSHLIRHFYQYICGGGGTGQKIQITSTTGCSSVLLSSIVGRHCVKTVHSWSGVRMTKGKYDDVLHRAMRNREAARNWKKTDILIVDEVSMLSAKFFRLLDALGKFHRRRPLLPFGGIQVVCLGDMYQLPPVPDRDDEDRDSDKFCFECTPLWLATFPWENHLELTHIYRQRDPKFREILNQVRVGQLSAENQEILLGYVGRKIDSMEKNGVVPLKILPTRNEVNAWNDAEYNKVREQEYLYRWNVVENFDDGTGSGSGTGTVTTTPNPEIKSLDEFALMEEDASARGSSAFGFGGPTPWKNLSLRERESILLSLQSSIPTEEIVKLKKHVPVMCLVNLELDAGICNGSLGVVIGFQATPGMTEIPIVRFTNGIIRPMGPYVWQHGEYPNVAIGQIPLCLSYSSTIHKLQGSTLDMAEMNLGGSIFAEGQTYVGLSRVRSLEGLYLTAFHPHRIRANDRVRAFYAAFPKHTHKSPSPSPETTPDSTKSNPNPKPKSVPQITRDLRMYFSQAQVPAPAPATPAHTETLSSSSSSVQNTKTVYL